MVLAWIRRLARHGGGRGSTRALVLSGGGIVGIAWEIGVVAGLAEAGIDVSDADLIVGTSAGSIVGSQLALGAKPAELFEEALREQLDPEHEALSTLANIDLAALWELAKKFIGQTDITQAIRQDIGALALKTETMDEEDWVAPFKERNEGGEWPDQRLTVTAVDVESGEFMAWDHKSGVDLGRAVASSCAVPALFPPVTIGGRRYMDGGIRSANNADLAQGYDAVLVVAFLNMFSQFSEPLKRSVETEFEALRESGSRVEVVIPDEAAVGAFGINPMDPAGRIPGAREGLRQGREVAESLREFWSVSVAVDSS